MYPLLAVGLFIVAFVLRFYGIQNNHPFWVDEFSSGTQARLFLDHGLGVFTNNDIFFEFQNITTHFIIALFFSIFGQHEWVARLPFVIIGSFVPIAVYFLTKQLSNKKTGIVAAILTTFSYFQITWSRQARGYVLLQLLILLTIYVYIKYLRSQHKNTKAIVGFCLLVGAGMLTHYMYAIALVAILIDYALINRNRIMHVLSKPLLYIFLVGIVLLVYGTGGFEGFQAFKSASFFSANNVGYYHSFLWREYGLITFLAILGWATLSFKALKETRSILLYVVLHLLFVTFFFGHHMSKYLLPIFPFLLMGAAMSIVTLSDNLTKHLKSNTLNKSLPIILALFIVLNGHKFVNGPQSYYSLNHDFREISNIDYYKVYEKILPHKARNPAVIETWPGRAFWYLQQSYPNTYMFRWENEEGFANGHIKKTAFYLEDGEKRLTKQVGFVGTKEDLEKLIKKNKVGFLFIDDSSLPQDVIQYAEKNLKKEIYLDHYPLDDNPYSIWPATLYSWGL